MTDDEYTILMIAAQGQSMLPIGRWKEPLEHLVAIGHMRAVDSQNHIITQAGCVAYQEEEAKRDQALGQAFSQAKQQAQAPTEFTVDMLVKGRQVKFNMTFDEYFIADCQTVHHLQKNGACEPELVHLMRRALRPGDFVIDGGANIGFMTLIMSRLVGDTGHVEAFEPATVNFKKLRRNIEINKIGNVNAINRAIWSDQSNKTLYISPDTGLCSLMPIESGVTNLPVQTLTLDQWCGNFDQRPRLLKLDIEGAEEHALLGADRMLSDGIDFVVCELNSEALHRFGSSQHDLRNLMERKGYSLFMMSENGDEPVEVPEDRVLEGPANMNGLFSKPDIVRRAWEEPL